MIYLIATSMLFNNMHSETILKIGYSDDSRGDNRFDDYRHSGLTIKILKTIPDCGRDIESLVQSYFKRYSIYGRSCEWFFYREEIVDFFNQMNSKKEILRFFFESDSLPDEFYLLPSLQTQMKLLLLAAESNKGISSSMLENYRKYISIKPVRIKHFIDRRYKFLYDLCYNGNATECFRMITELFPTSCVSKILEEFSAIRLLYYVEVLNSRILDPSKVEYSKDLLGKLIVENFKVGEVVSYEEADRRMNLFRSWIAPFNCWVYSDFDMIKEFLVIAEYDSDFQVLGYI